MSLAGLDELLSRLSQAEDSPPAQYDGGPEIPFQIIGRGIAGDIELVVDEKPDVSPILPISSTAVEPLVSLQATPAQWSYERYLDLGTHAGAGERVDVLDGLQEHWDQFTEDQLVHPSSSTSSFHLSDELLYPLSSLPSPFALSLVRDSEGDVVGCDASLLSDSDYQNVLAAARQNVSDHATSFATHDVLHVHETVPEAQDQDQKVEQAAEVCLSSFLTANSAATSSSIRGPIANTAFRPGGVEQTDMAAAKQPRPSSSSESLFPWLYGRPDALITTVPGLPRGLDDPVSNEKVTAYLPSVEKSGLLQSYIRALDQREQEQAEAEEAEAQVEGQVEGAGQEEGGSEGGGRAEGQEEAEAEAEAKHEAKAKEAEAPIETTDIYGDPSQWNATTIQQQLQRQQAQEAQQQQKQQQQQQQAKPDEEKKQAESKENIEGKKGGDEILEDAEEAEKMLLSGSQAAKAKGKPKKEVWAVQEKRNMANFHAEVPNMAIQFPFELDTFQKEAVYHLERGESVFVAAHTSAGKTVVAEYAIALAQKHLTRAVYTSPIKTLSNQKFREFRKTFGDADVGVITGDVSINPEASCLILTTEILRSMLYRGADLIRDIEWVIFDEVHYVNDIERGVVWEEVIIMLPDHVNIILLSATVPNVMEFADWVGRTKRKKIFVSSTDKRPVPLQHFLWAKGKMFNLVDQHGKWQAQAFRDARNEGMDSDKEKKRKLLGLQPTVKRFSAAAEKNQWMNLIKYLQKRELLPLAIFAFSKRLCEQSAFAMQSLDLTSSQEKSDITAFFNTALSRLSHDDRNLPQVTRVKDLLKKGVGVHHAGMLPILKEVVEMVFQKGWIKVLFATETFAMGVNMPTRTVVFHSFRKHDGHQFRDLLPGEYTQMAGRAGRRGLDTFGIVAINCRNDEIPDETAIKTMITGKPTKLESKFRLTYNMILNLLRQEDMRVEEMIKRSFGEAGAQREAPQQRATLKMDEAKLCELDASPLQCDVCSEQDMREAYEASTRLRNMRVRLMTKVMSEGAKSKLVMPGRVCVVDKFGVENTLAVILRSSSGAASYASGSELNDNARKSYLALILTPPDFQPPPPAVQRAKDLKLTLLCGKRYVVAELGPQDVRSITEEIVKFEFAAVYLDQHVRTIADAVKSLVALFEAYSVEDDQAAGGRRLVEDLPCVDPLRELKLNDLSLAEELSKREELTHRLHSSPCTHCPRWPQHFAHLSHESALRSRLSRLRAVLSDDNTRLYADFDKRLKVLQHLAYVNDERTVQLKGRAACEINTCDSLIVSELIFENVLTKLSPAELVSLLSCLIFQQKTDVEPVLTDSLKKALDHMSAVTKNLGVLQLQCGLDTPPDDYVKSNIKPGLMQVVYEWAQGVSFGKICEITDIEEGSIVRCIIRLDETCRDVRNAARVIGDPKLYQNAVAASELIKRDIVFAASLYVS